MNNEVSLFLLASQPRSAGKAGAIKSRARLCSDCPLFFSLRSSAPPLFEPPPWVASLPIFFIVPPRRLFYAIKKERGPKGQENGARVKKSKKRAGTMHRVDHQAIVAAFFIKALIFSGAPSVQTSLNHNTIDIITIINAK